jgi:hypothetical protein
MMMTIVHQLRHGRQDNNARCAQSSKAGQSGSNSKVKQSDVAAEHAEHTAVLSSVNGRITPLPCRPSSSPA